MSGLYTSNLNLFLTNMMTDGEDAFDFDRDLNQNFQKIDDAFANINFNPVGCINSGNTSSGEANVLSYSGQVITLAADTVMTLTNRVKVTLSSALNFTNTITADGIYHLFYKDAALISVADRYIQPAQPSPTGTAIWIDTSVEPNVAKYTINGGSTWSNVNVAYCGSYTVASSTVSSVIQPQFNQNYRDYKKCSRFNHGNIASGGSFTLKPEREQTAILGGAATINFPKNAPKGVNVQCRLHVTSSVANPALTINNAVGTALTVANKNWKSNYAPNLNTTTVIGDILLESVDGGITVVGHFGKIGS